ncbi:MAG: ATPase, T2SS/T4P/T4SS family [Phycisphaerales bacterium]|jgi:type IV pilus assembly protein PilB|nr:ATPase, T2SS/T4P/T4SS family [Phycisphaerales bacterium]|tara:strand:- start:3660 stop:5489 length:1830 start_codon:yes stop_codon:yes gene_type:complete
MAKSQAGDTRSKTRARVKGRSTGTSSRSTGGASELKGRRFGRVLVKLGVLTRDQVQEALAIQRARKEKGESSKIGAILKDLGYIKEEHILSAVAGQAGMEMVDVDPDALELSLVEHLPAETAKTYQIIPLSFDESSRSLTIAMKSPDNFRAVDDLRLLMGFTVNAVVAQPDVIDKAIEKLYAGAGSSMLDMMSQLEDSESLAALEGRGDSVDLEQVAQAADDNKVIRLLNLVLLQAIKDKASDIHFEPFENEFKMRYRIDGVLYEMVPPPPHLALPIVSRVKVMANLDIAERRLPQDGRIELTVNQLPIDLRVSVLPTMYGESVVMRVLDRSNVQLSLDKVGLRDDDLELMRELIRKPNGVVLITGPTGSGKTTTLYAALSELNDPDTKILTAEDPVEYDIDGLIQCQVNNDQDLTFARLLRSFLRQDPDTILVGEIRDLETAQIAIQASLTGHLVFSTLHTNDAPSTILRMVDLGVETFLITATVEAIVAQRLVRRICDKCKVEYEPSEAELMELELRPSEVAGRTFFRGDGCDNCNGTGYRGRLALYEIMVLDDGLREKIVAQTSTAGLKAECRRRGMRTLRETGLMSIYDGRTTIDEVVRETIAEE